MCSIDCPIKKSTQKTELIFLEIELLLDTRATICTLNTQTWNAIKMYLSATQYELKQDVDTNLKTANSQLLPTETMLSLHSSHLETTMQH